MTESDGEIGAGFSFEVAKAWEKELFTTDLAATRRVALYGLQRFSWVHIEDVARIINFLKATTPRRPTERRLAETRRQCGVDGDGA